MKINSQFTREGKGIEPGKLKRPGFPRYFEIIRFEWWNLIKLGCLTFACCLPIVTIPAAMGAMCVSISAMIADKPQFLYHDYLTAFRIHFKRSSCLGGIYAPLLLLSAAAASLYLFFIKNGGIIAMACGTAMLVSFQLILFSAFYAFPMLVKTDLPIKTVVKNAFLLVFFRDSLVRQLCIFCGECLAVFLIFWFYPYSVLLSVFFLLPLFFLLSTYFSWLGLEKHVFYQEGKSQ